MNLVIIEIGILLLKLDYVYDYDVCDFTYDVYVVKCVTRENFKNLQQFEGGPKTLSAVCSLTSSWHYHPVHGTGTISVLIFWVPISVYSPTSGLSSIALY